MIAAPTPQDRLAKLSEFAKLEFENSRDHAYSLARVTNNCAASALNADVLVADLMALFVGDDFRAGRGKGEYFIGNFRGALHFRPELRDAYNQVQHAVAGVLLAYKGILYIGIAKYLETEEQDIKLYDATEPLGKSLSDDNYKTLGTRLYLTIADMDSINAQFFTRSRIA